MGVRICLFGLGEAGSLIAVDLVAAGASVVGYDPASVVTPPGVARRVHPSLAVAGADVVLALTGGRDAELALLQALDAIPAGALYVDASTAAPAIKASLADHAARRELDFVDLALMSMVPGRGLATPALAAGSGAARVQAELNPLGAAIEAIPGPAGSAATKKLLRSVMMKGTAAVLAEAVRAGAAADDLDWLWANVEAEVRAADGGWMRRLVEGSGLHARRRRGEMEDARALLESLGVEPTMTGATIAALDQLVQGAPVPPIPGPVSSVPPS